MSINADKVRVTDVMEKDTVVLEPGDSLQKAIEMFENYGISGAPVVDGDGSLCGVLTASDLLPLGTSRSAADGDATSGPGETDRRSGGGPDAADDPARAQVRDWMTLEVLTVGPDATLGEVCSIMDRETVHRVFVTDGGQLLGVVSASDVVRHIARSSSSWVGTDWR